MDPSRPQCKHENNFTQGSLGPQKMALKHLVRINIKYNIYIYVFIHLSIYIYTWIYNNINHTKKIVILNNTEYMLTNSTVNNDKRMYFTSYIFLYVIVQIGRKWGITAWDGVYLLSLARSLLRFCSFCK